MRPRMAFCFGIADGDQPPASPNLVFYIQLYPQKCSGKERFGRYAEIVTHIVLLYPITSVVEIAMVPSGYVVSSGRNELVRCVAVGESHCDIYGEGDRIAEPYAATRR